MYLSGREHQHGISIGLWVMCGILTFLIIEKIFPDHREEFEDDMVSYFHNLASGLAGTVSHKEGFETENMFEPVSILGKLPLTYLALSSKGFRMF
jgi:hypothetical protein